VHASAATSATSAARATGQIAIHHILWFGPAEHSPVPAARSRRRRAQRRSRPARYRAAEGLVLTAASTTARWRGTGTADRHYARSPWIGAHGSPSEYVLLLMKGHAASEQGLPPVCPQGLDPLSFASGYVEGKARQSKPAPLRLAPRAADLFRDHAAARVAVAPDRRRIKFRRNIAFRSELSLAWVGARVPQPPFDPRIGPSPTAYLSGWGAIKLAQSWSPAESDPAGEC